MFRENDKINLSLLNAKDIKGNIIPFSLPLPLDNKEYDIPNELVSVDVCEYHEGTVIGGASVFSIYIGQKSTIERLFAKGSNNKIKIKNKLEIPTVDTPICYQENDGVKTVFAVLKSQDIVVSDQNQLLQILEVISNEYATICGAVDRIKGLSKETDNVKNKQLVKQK